MGDVSFGRYKLLGRIGRGGMAEVFAARLDGPVGFAKPVAIKRILPELCHQARFREMFASEARLAAVLDHANIVHVYELVQEDDALALVMEYADAGSLRRLLRLTARAEQQVPWPVVAKVGTDLAAALSYAHRRTDLHGRPLDIVHRDLSPENVLLTGSGGVKLTDFGIANARGQLERGLAGEVAGKPEYMPKEQYLGLASDGRTDVFALGAVLYEVATGEVAFPGGCESCLARNQQPAPLAELRPDLPAELCRAIERALATSLDERPSAEELGVMLGAVLGSHAGALTVGGLARYVAEWLPPLPVEPVDSPPSGEPRQEGDDIPTVAIRRRVERTPPLETFGRDSELGALLALLRRGTGLISLVGPPGVGKSHLAAALMAKPETRKDRRVLRLELAGLRGPAALWNALARALEAPLVAAGELEACIESLGRALQAAGPTLLVLDGGDALLEPLRLALPRWLARTPPVQFLLTTREALGLEGEMAFEVGPLALPAPGETGRGTAAVELYLARLGVQRTGYTRTADEATLRRAAEAVRRLEGIPLAIELAAAGERLRTTGSMPSPEGASETLARGALEPSTLGTPRPRSLRDAVTDSMERLEPWERSALVQSAVFGGGFLLLSAEAVIDLTAFPLAPSLQQVLEALVRKSLLRAEPSPHEGTVRYRHYEVIREQASEELHRRGEAGPVEARHADHFLGAAATWAEGAHGHMGPAMRRKLALEQQNLLAIHQRALEALPGSAEEANRALEAALVLDPLLSVEGPLAMELALLDSALALGQLRSGHPALLVRALCARGSLLRDQGKLLEAERDLSQALELAVQVDDPALGALARTYRAVVLVDLTRHTEAVHELSLALALLNRAPHRRLEALAYGTLGISALERGAIDEALSWHQRSADLLAELGDRRLEGIGLGYLANLHLELDHLDDARSAHERAIALLHEVGDRRHEAIFRGYLGLVHLQASDASLALESLEAAVGQLKTQGDARFEALFNGARGVALSLLGRRDEAASAFAAAEESLHALGDAVFLTAVKLYRGQLELALVEQARAAGMKGAAAAHLAAVEDALSDSAKELAEDNDVRLAHAMLRRRFSRLA